ncbi:MAG: hypothetical protein JO297_01655 [Nitrososphaeraceae archaeon]|nr:hypothetical protein [Nitrososphaeraceae archaeon]
MQEIEPHISSAGWDIRIPSSSYMSKAGEGPYTSVDYGSHFAKLGN